MTHEDAIEKRSIKRTYHYLIYDRDGKIYESRAVQAYNERAAREIIDAIIRDMGDGYML